MPQTKLPLSIIGWLLVLLTTVLADTDTATTNNTIVVHTPLQNYEQPTLRDYEECQSNRDKCVEVCDGDEDCQDECPVCPELYDKPLMVQGVNDTNVLAPAQTPINTTNIIRLTNEISNIIQHDIKNRNEVYVQVQQNVSQVGGRFGLGYTDQGSCCYVVRRSRECEHKDNCQERSRQRVCGERCQARVMLAKRVVQCDADEPTKCHETIEYVPRRRRTAVHRSESNASPCRYLGNSWPYVSCGQGQQQWQRVKRSSCQQCLNLPYGYVMQNGLPAQCSGCFQGYAAPFQPLYYAPYAPFNPYPQYAPFAPLPNNHNNNIFHGSGEEESSDDAGPTHGDWVMCESENIEDCLNNADGKGKPEQPEQLPQEQRPGPIVDYTDDDDYNVPVQRHRRRRQNGREFVRSLYSKRN
ncbi:uncharacterized protein LOC117585665 [Drosophila guanche]|uniref:Uncharacterized protein n=1 Tax=Drosophila guanche TaxID=7266 RepID=A0A3B0KEP9_DROGU|nr:uncharacterized protein LOC117585665 [Drosophila guanche]SPP83531.1 Hypothetical predicted protein [Drosophila guanche]